MARSVLPIISPVTELSKGLFGDLLMQLNTSRHDFKDAEISPFRPSKRRTLDGKALRKTRDSVNQEHKRSWVSLPYTTGR